MPLASRANESHCPVASWKWTVTSHVPRTTGNDLLGGGMAALVLVIGCYCLYVWFNRHRLRYLLRCSLFLLCVTSLLHGTCSPGEADHCCLLSTLKRTSLLLLLVMLVVRYHWSTPLDITKDEWSVGFSHLSKVPGQGRVRSHRHLVRQRLSEADLGQVPPVYPNGWIPLIESSRVDKGQVVSVTALGHRFCVFRGKEEKGEVFVLDAYCPHLGADLSAGGRVEGNCIECPFHGWKFKGEDGTCTAIPYSNKIPEVARAPKWPSCECNAFIFVWHHADGERPTWEMPIVVDPCDTGRWRYRGRTEHKVHCHIQEIPENGADIQHIHQVHSKSIFLGSDWMYGPTSLLQCVRHDWRPDWGTDPQFPHVARIRLSQQMRFLGVPLPFSRLQLDIRQVGPASVHLHLETCFGRGVLLQHIVPEGPLSQKLVHLLYTEPGFKQFPADLLMWGEAVMLERDISVWNNKKFLRTPLLVREDRLISRYRRWYSQFYSPNSSTLRQARERMGHW